MKVQGKKFFDYHAPLNAEFKYFEDIIHNCVKIDYA